MRSIPPILHMAIFILLIAAFPDASAQTDQLKPEQCLGGELDAPIRIEVFSDFECPACREFYLNTIRPVLKDYCSLDKVCVVYHEFPLQGHKYSRQAAQYSKAAHGWDENNGSQWWMRSTKTSSSGIRTARWMMSFSRLWEPMNISD